MAAVDEPALLTTSPQSPNGVPLDHREASHCVGMTDIADPATKRRQRLESRARRLLPKHIVQD